MRLWVLGNADRASRDMRSSLKRLEAAEEEAIKRLGESHREVARIRMDLALTLAADADGSTDARVAAMVRSAVPVIKAAYPDGHRFSKILDGLALATGDPAAEPDAALRRSIARLAASGPVFFI